MTIYGRIRKCGLVELSIKESIKDLKVYSERFSIFCTKAKNINLLFPHTKIYVCETDILCLKILKQALTLFSSKAKIVDAARSSSKVCSLNALEIF